MSGVVALVRFRVVAAFIVLAVATAVPPPPAAAFLTRALGPYGGSVYNVAVSPDGSVVLAATRHGLFRRDERLGRWAPVPGMDPYVIVFHPVIPGLVYADNGHLARSTDGGLTWTRLDGPAYDIRDLVIPAAAPASLFAVTSDAVYRSDDRGETWSTLAGDPGATDVLIRAFDVSPSNPAVMYLGRTDGTWPDMRDSAWRSTDGGATWSKLPYEGAIVDLAINPEDPTQFFATDVQYLWRATSGGDVWEKTNRMARFVTYPSASGSLVLVTGMGSYGDSLGRSDDGGTTWTEVSVPVHARTPRVNPANTDVIYVPSNRRGVYRSTDGGETMHQHNEGLTAAPVTDVAFDQDGANTYVTLDPLGEAGVFRTDTGGLTWSQIDAGIPRPEWGPDSAFHVSGLVVDPSNTLYTVRSEARSSPSLVASKDNGATWTPASGELPYRRANVSRLVGHPVTPGVLLASMASEMWVETGPDGGVFRTDDAGATWREVGPLQDSVFDMVGKRRTARVFIGTHREDPNAEMTTALHVSEDFGESWKRLPYPTEPRCRETALEIGPGEQTFFVGTACGEVHVTVDGGASWYGHKQLWETQVPPTGGVHDIAADPADPQQLLAATTDGLWLSPDLGRTWHPIPGHSGNYTVHALAFAPAVSEELGSSVAQPAVLGLEAGQHSGMSLFTPPPRARAVPAIAGTVRRGSTVECSPRLWSRAREFRYRWMRSGEFIPDASARTYKVSAADGGAVLQCHVTGRGPGGASSVRSTGVRVRDVYVPAPSASSGTKMRARRMLTLIGKSNERGARSYDRSKFKHWTDANGDGCDTRQAVLISESRISASRRADCTVTSGRWVSLYDGKRWSKPSDVDIDHVVALKEAWVSGARNWSGSTRRNYANDLNWKHSLRAVTDNVKQSKGHQDPAEWLPPRARCTYAINWVQVKYRWRLKADRAERAAIADIFATDCGSRRIAVPRRAR